MSDDIPVKSPSTYDLQIPGQEVIWTGVPRPEYSQEVGHRSHSFVLGNLPLYSSKCHAAFMFLCSLYSILVLRYLQWPLMR